MTEVERLRGALRFYADQDNYYTMSMMLRKKPEDEYPPIWIDRGAIARAALDGEEAAKDEGKYGDWRDTSVDYGL